MAVPSVLSPGGRAMARACTPAQNCFSVNHSFVPLRTRVSLTFRGKCFGGLSLEGLSYKLVCYMWGPTLHSPWRTWELGVPSLCYGTVLEVGSIARVWVFSHLPKAQE